jgi:hypothetical protein
MLGSTEPLKVSPADASNQIAPAGIECSSIVQKKLQQVVKLFIFDCSDRGVERERIGILCALAHSPCPTSLLMYEFP